MSDLFHDDVPLEFIKQVFEVIRDTPFSGQRFRDPRDPNQMSFDILQPDFTPLESRILELLGERDHNLEELREDAYLRRSTRKPTSSRRPTGS